MKKIFLTLVCLLATSSTLAATVRFICPPLKDVRVVNYNGSNWKVFGKLIKEIEQVSVEQVQIGVYLPINKPKPELTEFDMIYVHPASIFGYKINCHYFGAPALTYEDYKVSGCEKIHDNLVQCETR